MLKKIRTRIVMSLWELYRQHSNQMSAVEMQLKKKHFAQPPLDHFALIDLPSSFTGIPTMCDIFSALGFVVRGKDYLADKQNNFSWMVENDFAEMAANQILPQIVIADFRLEEMPAEVADIIKKYVSLANPFDHSHFKDLLTQAINLDIHAEDALIQLLTNYFSGRDWPLPNLAEFNTVRSFNELLAWVLIFGRKPNHFTFAVHLTHDFKRFTDFLLFVEKEVQLSLNQEGGVIKGGEDVGISQASTLGNIQCIKLEDGDIYLPSAFIEFVWRYPKDASLKPVYWKDYYTDFIAQHANRVVESLCVRE